MVNPISQALVALAMLVLCAGFILDIWRNGAGREP